MENCQPTIEKKSLDSTFGSIEISNSNPLLVLYNNRRVSPLLNEKIVFIGQLDSYEKGSEIACHLLNLKISDSKIYRLTDEIGSEAANWLEEEDFRTELPKEGVIYGQMDGSMILTRESGWKETKLGRIFSSQDIYEETNNRNWLRNSEYVAHLGSHTVFETSFSKILDRYSDRNENLVFINDGARWQWNWITAEYPKATQILDFFHAMEHIGSFVSLIKKGKEKTQFMENISNSLKHKGVKNCWEKLNKLECKTKKQKSEKQSLKTYMDNNESRMDYPKYLSRNLLIGSGAIESAHRTVIQKRMKLSGQRWSENGAKNMLNIRVVNMSGHWNRVQKFFRLRA